MILGGSEVCKISVVVPVYNGESFLADTLKSILEQDFDSYEIIVVDDGSSDNSAEIAESLFAKYTDPSVEKTVLRIRHSGVCVARNSGLENASGKYVLFFDSDDVMKKDFLRKAFQKIEETEADVLLSQFDMLNEAGNVISRYIESFSSFGQVLRGNEVLEMFLNRIVGFCLQSQLYRISFLKKHALLFQPGALYGEDQEFFGKSLCLAGKVSMLQETGVYYVRRRSSVTHEYNLNRFHHVGSIRRLREFIARKDCSGKTLEVMDGTFLPHSYVSVLDSLFRPEFSLRVLIGILKNCTIKSNLILYRKNACNPRESIKAFLYLRLPSVIYLYRSLLNRYQRK